MLPKAKVGPNYDIKFTEQFKWLKNLYTLYNVKVSGESESADVKAAEEYLKTLNKLIADKITCWRKY